MKHLLIAFLLLAAVHSNAQSSKRQLKSDTLKTEILKMDSLFFSVGFNLNDTVIYKNILSDSMEFYDDRDGLNLSKENEIKFIVEKSHWTHNMTRVLKSTTISRLGNFGALQRGEHEFVRNGIIIGSAKFIHIWERTDHGWKLKRIISYDHVSTGK
jgi:Domain of unknown function (DUF4440)